MASDFKWDPGHGGLFKNQYKEKDNQPDVTGDITLEDGTQKRLAGWWKTGKNGRWLSLNISDPKPKNTPPPPDEDPFDNDIPF